MKNIDIVIEELMDAVDESTDCFGANVDKWHLASLFRDIVYKNFNKI